MTERTRDESILTAIAMAMWLSVTVSIGDDMMGVLIVMFFVKDDVRSCRPQKHAAVHTLESRRSRINMNTHTYGALSNV